MLVYLNGEFIAEEEARVPVDDRGFLFADGVYEVARVYDGRIFKWAEHLQRMSDGLAAIRIDFPDIQALTQVAERLLDENGLRAGGSTVYIQVTRGVAPRKHAFPQGVQPTVFLAVKPYAEPPLEYWTDGVGAIRYPDIRWARCDIKSVALLGNVLANQAAHEVDAFEALFVRDGVVIEGSHSNFAAVMDGTLVTYPRCNWILPGITRATVLQFCHDMGIPVREGPVYDHELFQAQELMLLGTTTEVMPVVRVDGRDIGDGTPGPVTCRLIDAYRAATR